MRHARWLIARGNVFAPSALAVAKLVVELRNAGFLPDPKAPDFAKMTFNGPRDTFARETGGYAVHTVENTFDGNEEAARKATTEPTPLDLTKDWLDDCDREELRLVWPVSDGGELSAPIASSPPAYGVEIHRSLEFVYPTAKGVGPLDATCRCSEDLSFEWDADEVVPAFTNATGIFAECDECSRTFDPAKVSAAIEDPTSKKKEDVPGGAAYRFAIVVIADGPVGRFSEALIALVEKEFGRSFYEVAASF